MSTPPKDLWAPTREERQVIWSAINKGTATRNQCMSLVYCADHLEEQLDELRAALEDAITGLESQQAMPDDSTREKYQHLFHAKPCTSAPDAL